MSTSRVSLVEGDTEAFTDMAAAGPPPELSIVVPAYNEEQRIGACIRSLVHQETDRTYEVILVDNHSTDATLAVARVAAAGRHLRVVHESRHGRGAARRAGFEAALGQVVLSAMQTRSIRLAG